MKKYFYVALLFLTYLFYGFTVSRFEVSQLPASIEYPQPKPFYDYRGVTNVHSSLSLGSGEINQIIAAAQEAELDFIFITDLNQFEPSNINEAYHQNLLFLNAGKYSYLDSRFIYYSATSLPPAPSLGEVQVKFADWFSQNSNHLNENFFMIMAHPFRKGFSWSGVYPANLGGIEVINLREVQQTGWEASKLSSIWSFLIYPFNPSLAFLRLFEEPQREFLLWNQLNHERSIPGHLGLEATAKAIPFTGSTINFPSYETTFKLASQHVLLRSELTGNTESDKQKILRALKRGEFYFSLDILGNPKGFSTTLRQADKTVLMGNGARLSKDTYLHINMPLRPKCDFEIVVFKDGDREAGYSTQEVRHPITSPGLYRVMVRLIPQFPLPDAKKWIPWIYTNHFKVTP